MADRGDIPLRAVALVVALGLVAGGFVIHAAREHGEDDAVKPQPIPSIPDLNPSVSHSPTTSTDPTEAPIPKPPPQQVKVGEAICDDSEYNLTPSLLRDPLTGPQTGTYYYLTAKYTGPANSRCIFTDYPTLTVQGPGGGRRTLHIHGGFVEGYGQAPPIILSKDQPAATYLLVEKKPTSDGPCNKQTPTFKDVQLAGHKLIATVSGWCTMAESPWLPVGASAGGPADLGPALCKPYDLKLLPAPTPANTRAGLRYTLTVKHTKRTLCVLNDFPRLAASLYKGTSLHQLKLTHHPKGPPITLSGTATEATMTVVVTGGRCAGPHPALTQLRVENLFEKKHPINIPKWCSITESYWTAGA